MSHFHTRYISQNQIVIQRAEGTSQKTVQVGGNYTQTQTLRFNLWISLICILIFAATASVVVSLFGRDKLPAEMPIEETVLMELFAD